MVYRGSTINANLYYPNLQPFQDRAATSQPISASNANTIQYQQPEYKQNCVPGTSASAAARSRRSIKPATTNPRPNKRSIIDEIDHFRHADKKRMIKSSINTVHLSPRSARIHKFSTIRQTRQFPSIFPTADVAKHALERFVQSHQKPFKDCSFPETDETFPNTDEERLGVVKSVFDAICDWSHILEWKAALPRKNRKAVLESLVAARASSAGNAANARKSSIEDIQPTAEELASVMPSIEVQQKLVLGQVPSDQTIEWLAWGVVVRDNSEHSTTDQIVSRIDIGTGSGYSIAAGTYPATALVRVRRRLGAVSDVPGSHGRSLFCSKGMLFFSSHNVNGYTCSHLAALQAAGQVAAECRERLANANSK